MPVQLGHEALAEAHDLRVALALGVEVGAAFGAAHGQAGQAVLQDLLKAQELQDGQVHGGMEAETALVGADGGVELHPVSPVHMHLAVVVHPGHPEADHALRLHEHLDDAVPLVLRMLLDDQIQALQNLQDRLVELLLIGITSDNLGVNPL